MVRGSEDPLVEQLIVRYAKLIGTYSEVEETKWHQAVGKALVVLECEVSISQGTAFALQGGGFLTCAHVLGPRTCGFRHDALGNKVPINVRHRSDGLDLALIDIPGIEANGLVLDQAARFDVGDLIRLAGYPNYQLGDTGIFLTARVAGYRPAAGNPAFWSTGR